MDTKEAVNGFATESKMIFNRHLRIFAWGMVVSSMGLAWVSWVCLWGWLPFPCVCLCRRIVISSIVLVASLSVRLWVRSFVCLFVSLLVRSFVSLFVCSLLLSFIRSF